MWDGPVSRVNGGGKTCLDQLAADRCRSAVVAGAPEDIASLPAGKFVDVPLRHVVQGQS